tara:strand:+ start:720 stop:1295 length:576 start_codon:yes stop_codon:yes gene_type:complete
MGDGMKELNWEKACKTHHLLQENAPLIIDITPSMKAIILDLKGPAQLQLETVLHRYLDERIASWVNRSGAKCPTSSTRISGDLHLRQRKEGCITAEHRGAGYLLNAKSLRLGTLLPETLAQSYVGRTVADIADGLSQNEDGKRLITGYHRTAESKTILRLVDTVLAFLTYRELFGNPENRFSHEHRLALAS